MVEQTDWDKFVTYTQSKKFKVQNNELSVHVIPSRALMWRKTRENKNEEYKNVIKDMADKLVSLTLNFFGFIFSLL
ncbi:hypothetical protein Hanom_Chr09g00770761 [Helianthus anomalus]